MSRVQAMGEGSIGKDGAAFILDKTPDTYTWEGKTFLGYGVHKLTRADDGVGVKSQLVYADKHNMFAYDEYAFFVRLLRAGAFLPS